MFHQKALLPNQAALNLHAADVIPAIKMFPKKNLIRNIKKAVLEPKYAVNAFIKRFKGYLSYRFLKGKSSNPEGITLFLTHNCNLKCKMCGQWANEDRKKIIEEHKQPNELFTEH